MEAFAVAVIPLAGATVGAGVAVGCVGATPSWAALPGLVLQSAVPALQLETELLQAC